MPCFYSIWPQHEPTTVERRFIDEIRHRFLGDKTDAELPQHDSLLKSIDVDTLVKRACDHLYFDLESASRSRRIRPDDMDRRDLLLYLLKSTGRLSNQEIGLRFGLTYFAVSRRVKILGERLSSDREMAAGYADLKMHVRGIIDFTGS